MNLLLRERHIIFERAFVEMVVWRLPVPVLRSRHIFKYRLAFIVDGVCVIRYDDEAGKGDHVHRGGVELPYNFLSPEKLVDDLLGRGQYLE